MIYIIRTVPHADPDAWDDWEVSAPDPVTALAALYEQLGADVKDWEHGSTRTDFRITQQRLKNTAHTE